MVTPMVQDVPEHLVEAGRGYERLFVPALFHAWTKHLVDGARVQEGLHVLDVACGTGVLSRSALNRNGANGRVVGINPAPGMLAAANEIEPSIEWGWVIPRKVAAFRQRDFYLERIYK